MSVTVLAAVTTIGVVWGAAGVVLYVVVSRALNYPDPAQPAEYSNLDALDDLLDDQPADVLTDEALARRFNKILVDNGMKDAR
jgi:hypothetical protein